MSEAVSELPTLLDPRRFMSHARQQISDNAGLQSARHRWGTCAVATAEVLLICVLFFVLAGGVPPDVNEAHYLGKAKHYWNPDWCRGDLFLESADAHLTFYWSVGWLTRFLSLNAAAWVGRGTAWLLLAWSWRRLSVAVVPTPLASLLTAGLLTLLLRCTHMAGEWVVGGVEAKSFAFVFFFLGLEALVRNRWRGVWVLFGTAAAFHVLVGGWSVIIAMLVWLMARNERPALTPMLPALMLGGLISLAGLLPGLMLTSGVDAELVRQANEIYVHQRLAHHLLFHRILAQPIVLDFAFLGWPPVIVNLSHLYFLRHLTGIVVGVGLWRFVRPTNGMWRLCCFAAAAIMVAAVGVVIDQITMYSEPLSARLMRYYWFRLSDVMVPVSVALLAARAIEKLQSTWPRAYCWALAGCIVLVALNTGDAFARRRYDPKPAAVVQAQPSELSKQQTDRCYQDWRAACAWIATNTPPGEVVLTPRHQQTFKWYAQRAEVVNWKDIPQDAAGVLEWRRRIDEIFPKRVGGFDLAAHGRQELQRLSAKYSFRYVVIDRSRSRLPLRLPRVYPPPWQANACFEIYRVPSAASVP